MQQNRPERVPARNQRPADSNTTAAPDTPAVIEHDGFAYVDRARMETWLAGFQERVERRLAGATGEEARRKAELEEWIATFMRHGMTRAEAEEKIRQVLYSTALREGLLPAAQEAGDGG